MIEWSLLLDVFAEVKLKSVKLKSAARHMDTSLAQRSEIRPSNRIHIVRSDGLTITLDDLAHIQIQNLKQYHNIRLQQMSDLLIDNEFLVPFTRVLTFDSHIKESSGHWKNEVFKLLLLKFARIITMIVFWVSHKLDTLLVVNSRLTPIAFG